MLSFDLFRNDPDFVRIKKGEPLFNEGDRGDVMYVLISGKAEVAMSGVAIEVCTSGDVVGELACIDGSARAATVTAHTDCEFAVIDKKRFQFLVDESPRFALDVMRVIARRLKECDRRLLEAISERRSIS